MRNGPVKDRAAEGLRGGDMLAGPQDPSSGEGRAVRVSGQWAGRLCRGKAQSSTLLHLTTYQSDLGDRDREKRRRYPLMSRRDARDQQVLRNHHSHVL